MQRRGREAESLGVVRDQGRSSEGRRSLRGNRGWICWAEIWVSVLCGRPTFCFLLLISARGGRREILSVDLDCDCAFALWSHGFWSDGQTFVRGRGRCVCDIEAIVIVIRDFVSVFVDENDFLCGCVLRRLSSLLDIVSSGLCFCATSLTSSHRPSRVDSVYQVQKALPSTFPLALRLSAVSSCHHRHDSQHLLCFSSHRSPGLLVSLSSLPSPSLAKLHYDYPRLLLNSSKIGCWALAHSCLAVPL